MQKNILITGAAKRIGAACARLLHAQGHNIFIHYRASKTEAENLCAELNALRPDSARCYAADLLNMEALKQLANTAQQAWNGIDVLINNASGFYATDVLNTSEAQWDDLLNSNLKAPFFLSTLLADTLASKQGCIINITDIHAERGLNNYAVYSISKAGLVMMTKVLAKEFGEKIRVNGVAPGAILWHEQGMADTDKQEILQRVPLQRRGKPHDIAKAIAFLINDADYMTGQILTVDGGRTLFY